MVRLPLEPELLRDRYSNMRRAVAKVMSILVSYRCAHDGDF